MSFDDFIRTDAGFAYIMSATFEQRAVALCRRIIAGERLNLVQAAAVVDLPIVVFLELLPALQADLAMHAEACSVTVH